MNTLKRFTLIVTILILTACSVPPAATATPQPTTNADIATLAQNHQKWDALKATHYRFKLNIGCFCGFRNKMPLSIEVKDGKVVSMLDNDGQSILKVDEDVFNNYNTIEKIFNTFTDALNNGADMTTVEYATDGYPQSIYIDYKTNVSDDEISFTITDFQIIK